MGLLYFVLLLVRKNRGHSLNQSHRSKTGANHDFVARVVPRLGSLLVFTLNLIGSERYFSFLLIGLCNNFGFGFTTLNPEPLHLSRVFSCRFNYAVASPSYEMNDLKQFLLELNETNLSRKLDKRHHIVLQDLCVSSHST